MSDGLRDNPYTRITIIPPQECVPTETETRDDGIPPILDQDEIDGLLTTFGPKETETKHMNAEERNEAMQEFFKDCLAVSSVKGKDYAKDQDAFHNFTTAAEALGVSVPQSIWVHAEKHLSAVRRFVREGELAGEPIREKLTDMANYCAILAAWVEADWEERKTSCA